MRRSGEIILFGLILFFVDILFSFVGLFSVPLIYELGLLAIAVLIMMSGYGLSKFENRFG